MADYIYILTDTEINLNKYQTGDRILIIGSESNLQNISFSPLYHYRIDLFGKGLSGYVNTVYDSHKGDGWGYGGYSSFEFTPTSEIFQLLYNSNYLYINSGSLSFLEPKYRALAVAGSAGTPKKISGWDGNPYYKSGHGGGLEGYSYNDDSVDYSSTVCSGQTARSGTVWMSTNGYGGFGWYSGNTSDRYGGGGGSGFILGKTTTTYPSGFYGDDLALLEKVSSTIGDSWSCVTGGRRGNSVLMELFNIESTHTYGDIIVYYNPETRIIGSAGSGSKYIHIEAITSFIVITVGDITYNPETQAVISFDTNGGYPIERILVDKGSAFEMVVPTREPTNKYQVCEFVRWYKDGAPFEEGTIIEEDMTLKASWLIKQIGGLNPYYKKDSTFKNSHVYKIKKTPKYIPAGFVDIETTSYPYTGQSQTVTLDPGLYRFRCWGAQGGSYSNTYQGGAGGYSEGVIRLEESTTLYLYVGGQSPTFTGSTVSDAGFNGAGKGDYTYYNGTYTYAQGGGGGTDIRIGSDSLYARVIVAGGGAGASNSYNALTTRYGGGLTGGAYSSTYQATQTSGNAFGIGQNGYSAYNYRYTSAGSGGGWYGGKSEQSQSDSNNYSSYTSGGSGYIYTEETASNYPSGCLLNSSYYLSDAKTIAGNMSIPDPNDFSQTTIGRIGNGYIAISKVEELPGEWIDEITLEPIDLFYGSEKEEL